MRVILSPTVRGLFVVSLISAVACGGDEASVADGTNGTAGKAAGGAAGKAAGGAVGSNAQAGKSGAPAAGTGGTGAGTGGGTAAGAGGTASAGAAGQGTAGTTALGGAAGTGTAGTAGSAGATAAGAAGSGQAGTSAGGNAAGGSDAGGAAGTSSGGSSAGGAAGSASGVSCNIGTTGTCASSEYCRPKDGTCGISGTCETMPTLCPVGCSLEGVCGCDGKTYCNACVAAAVGVGVSPDPSSCGAAAACGPMIPKPCGSGTYCSYDESDACGKAGEGTCKPVPAVCTKEIAPVCGCDQKTYQNACLAAAAGAAVAADGPCEKGTVCTTSADCTGTQYCLLGKSCGAPGTCADRPAICTKELAEVCGCDGKTYDNACLARQAGASVDTRSTDADACLSPIGVTCGGKLGKTCAANEYCDYPDALCGAADGSGQCKPRPALCTKQLAPVCGCDNKTYNNDCLARQAGVDAATPGACSTPKKACGPSEGGAVCGLGEYCKYASAEDACGYQTSGTCEPVPPACTATCDKPSLCGCDGKFYCAECAAAAAGTSPAPTSVCQGTQPKLCKSNLDCGTKLGFCKFTEADVCGKVSTGVCATRPLACPPICNLIGICACDGKRYCSECEAEQNGVSPAPDAVCGGGPSPI